MNRRATAGALAPKNSALASASSRCRVSGETETGTTFGFVLGLLSALPTTERGYRSGHGESNPSYYYGNIAMDLG